MTDKLQPSPPMKVDLPSLDLARDQKDWLYEVDSPDRGKIRIELSNYTNKPKSFKIYIEEIDE